MILEAIKDKGREFFGIGKFQRMFYVILCFEILERGAFYGMLAVLPYHTVYNLGMSPTAFGLIMSVIMPFLYFLPVFAGAIAEKFGLRKMFIVAFAITGVGYFMSTFMDSFYPLLLTMLVMSFGTGIFKPVDTAAIAHTTSDEHRNSAYTLSYWTINLGAMIFPFLIAVLIPAHLYAYAFTVSAVLVGINVLILTFVFRDPIEPQPDVSVWDSLKNIKVIVEDKRFLALILIISGFGFMYAVLFVALQLYMVDFRVITWSWFTPAMLGIVNPLVILLAAPVLQGVVDRYDSLKLCFIGIALSCIGCFTIGVVNHPVAFFTGIAIFTVGEFITFPVFLSYSSKIAPEGKITMYMAYFFVSSFIGSFFGNAGGAWLYEVVAQEMLRPKLFWAIVGSTGLITLSSFSLYNAVVSRTDARVAREDAGDSYVEPEPLTLVQKLRSPTSPLFIILPILLILPVLTVSYGMGTDTFFRGIGEEMEWDLDEWVAHDTPVRLADGQLGEGGVKMISGLEQNETHRIIGIEGVLSWVDENDQNFMTNQPDTFSAWISINNTEMVRESGSNTVGNAGTIKVSHMIPNVDANETWTWTLTVKLDEAADQVGNGAGFIGYTDNGNTYALRYTVRYIEPPVDEEDE